MRRWGGRACGALLVAAGCTAPAPPVAPARDGVVTLSEAGIAHAEVRWVVLAPSSFAPRLTTTATLAADPRDIAHVGPRSAGRVAEIAVRLGDTVAVGQPLIEVDTAELHVVATEYLIALARSGEMRDALARQRQLSAARVGAAQDLRRAEAAAQTAEVALREAAEHLGFLGLDGRAIAGLRRDGPQPPPRGILRAPIAGRVEAITATLGQALVGTEDLVTVVRHDRIWAVLRVYERDLPLITAGAAVQITAASAPDRPVGATVDAISALVDPLTRTVEVRAGLDASDNGLRPGTSAVAVVTLAAAPRSLWLPVEALQSHQGGPIVFVRVGAGRFAARAVEAGAERGGYVPIVAGLRAQEEVVVHGALALRGELELDDLQGGP